MFADGFFRSGRSILISEDVALVIMWFSYNACRRANGYAVDNLCRTSY
jgi:hypothetical protein